MIKNLDLAPLSLNPEHADQEPSSPINFLNGKNKQYKQSLLKQKQDLKNKLNQLSDHVESKRKHANVINRELDKQNQKIQYWKDKFNQTQKDYSQRVQILYRLKEQVNSKPPTRMKCDNEEEHEGADNLKEKQIIEERKSKPKIILKATSIRKRQSTKVEGNETSFQRIKSIVMTKKTMKRGQTLSLTHLHTRN